MPGKIKPSYISGLDSMGEIPESINAVIDGGSGEFKLMVRGDDGNFADFDPGNRHHIYCYKPLMDNFIRQARLLVGQNDRVEYKKAAIFKAVQGNLADSFELPANETLTQLVKAIRQGNSDIPIFVTGIFRYCEEVQKDLKVITLKQDDEIALTAYSQISSKEAENKEVLISGSLGYTINSFPMLSKELDFSTIGMLAKKLDNGFITHAKDELKNNSNLGRLIALCAHIAERKPKNAFITTGNSTLGFVVNIDIEKISKITEFKGELTSALQPISHDYTSLAGEVAASKIMKFTQSEPIYTEKQLHVMLTTVLCYDQLSQASASKEEIYQRMNSLTESIGSGANLHRHYEKIIAVLAQNDMSCLVSRELTQNTSFKNCSSMNTCRNTY